MWFARNTSGSAFGVTYGVARNLGKNRVSRLARATKTERSLHVASPSYVVAGRLSHVAGDDRRKGLQCVVVIRLWHSTSHSHTVMQSHKTHFLRSCTGTKVCGVDCRVHLVLSALGCSVSRRDCTRTETLTKRTRRASRQNLYGRITASYCETPS